MTTIALWRRFGRAVLVFVLTAPALLALGGQASADMHFNPDVCLDMSSIDFFKDGKEYHWVEAAGPTTDGCSLWVAVPYE